MTFLFVIGFAEGLCWAAAAALYALSFTIRWGIIAPVVIVRAAVVGFSAGVLWAWREPSTWRHRDTGGR
jgi:hypothetical protein